MTEQINSQALYIQFADRPGTPVYQRWLKAGDALDEIKMNKTRGFSAFLSAALLGFSGVTSSADRELKANHQWPGGKGDFGNEMVQMIERDVEAAWYIAVNCAPGYCDQVA